MDAATLSLPAHASSHRGAELARPTAALIPRIDGLGPDDRVLLCLPPAGVGAAFYRPWTNAPSAGTRVVAVELPGHGRRLGERAYDDFDALADDLAREVTTAAWPRWAAYGHSMGGLLAAAVAERTEASGCRPERIVLGACAPPWEFTSASTLDALDDEGLIDYLARLGGLPEVVQRHPRFLKMFLRTFRADLRLAAGHQPTTPTRLACPVTIVAGEHDLLVPPAVIPGWRAVSADTEIVMVAEGHFFGPDTWARVGDLTWRS